MRIFLQYLYMDLKLFTLSGYNHIIFAGYVTINCKRIDILAEAYPSNCNNDRKCIAESFIFNHLCLRNEEASDRAMFVT